MHGSQSYKITTQDTTPLQKREQFIVYANRTTMRDLKNQIAKKYETDADCIQIILSGQVLSDDKKNQTLSQLDIGKDATLYIHVKDKKLSRKQVKRSQFDNIGLWESTNIKNKHYAHNNYMYSSLLNYINKSFFMQKNSYDEDENDFNDPSQWCSNNYVLFNDPILITYTDNNKNKRSEERHYEREDFNNRLELHNKDVREFYKSQGLNDDNHLKEVPTFRTNNGLVVNTDLPINQYTDEQLKTKIDGYKRFIDNIKISIKINCPHKFNHILNDDNKLLYIRNEFLGIKQDSDLDKINVCKKINDFNKEFQPIADSYNLHNKYFDGEAVSRHSLRAQSTINFILDKKIH